MDFLTPSKACSLGVWKCHCTSSKFFPPTCIMLPLAGLTCTQFLFFKTFEVSTVEAEMQASAEHKKSLSKPVSSTQVRLTLLIQHPNLLHNHDNEAYAKPGRARKGRRRARKGRARKGRARKGRGRARKGRAKQERAEQGSVGQGQEPCTMHSSSKVLALN